MIWGLRFEHMLFNGDSYSKEFYTTCLLLWLGVSPHPLNYSSSSVRVGWQHLSFQALFWCSRTPDHDFLWPCHKESKVCEIYGSQLVHSSGIWQGSGHQKRHVSRWDWTMFPKHRCHSMFDNQCSWDGLYWKKTNLSITSIRYDWIQV